MSPQLIPGLPNDLAIQCLLCVSAEELVRLQKVSPLWKTVIQSDRFYVERKRRQAYPSVFAIRRTPDCYQCLDAGIADLQNPRLLFSCDLLQGEKLFSPGMVFASVQTSVYGFAPGQNVQKFSLLTRRWTEVSKRFPTQCKLLAATVGSHVVVIACDEGDNLHNNGVETSQNVCEMLDTHTHEWVCIGGLPEIFHGIHCITHQGTVFVKGKMDDDSLAVLGLNLTKRRWEEDAHMTAMLYPLVENAKIILKPSAVLMVTVSMDRLLIQHYSVADDTWVNVVSFNILSRSRDYFFFKQGEQIFFAVPSEAPSWRIKSVFCYHGLKILSIPADALLMVDAVA